MSKIPFNSPYICGNEHDVIFDVIQSGHLEGDGKYTKLAHKSLKFLLGAEYALLTTSGTSALELCSLALGLGAGDEVILPSFTFVSTANAFAKFGIKPVFVDIRPDTLNIDENLIEAAITKKTKAIVCVHYAGVSCEMDTIKKIAKKYSLFVVEDAAQAIDSFYKGDALGKIGDVGALSFHASKNINCGEGGAFITNSAKYYKRAEIAREKGTNRSSFLKGEIDKYTWQSIGSSYLPSELNAAFLFAQLKTVDKVSEQRLLAWNYYYKALQPNMGSGDLHLPVIPNGAVHNGHIFWMLLKSEHERIAFQAYMKKYGIICTSHYVPLHNTDMAKRVACTSMSMKVTESICPRLVRLPIWPGVNYEYVADIAANYFAK